MQSFAYRLSVQQRIVQLAVAGLMGLLALLQLASGVPGLGALFLLVAAMGVGQFFWIGTFGVEVTPQGITLRGYTRRYFAWNQIARIYGGNFMIGQRRTYFQLTNGSTIRSWAPMNYWSMPDAAFDQKVATLQQWHAHFAMGGQPPQQQYGPQLGAPQPQYGAPQYGAPQYGAPQYGAPQPPYATPQIPQGYGPPSQPYAPPYAQPQQGYAHPQAAPYQHPYAAPQQPYTPPVPPQPYPEPTPQPQPPAPAGEWTMMFGADEQTPPN
ncbi:MAG: hypothetical protein JWN00_959 [Actinomycetia bacterium]|nr:hypothetical protein [Actinomycetes bacterium]